MAGEKEIRWIGSCYADLLAFPDDARREAGFQLGRVPSGLEPPTGNRSTTLELAQRKSASETQAALVA
jgi:phage-related protein